MDLGAAARLDHERGSATTHPIARWRSSIGALGVVLSTLLSSSALAQDSLWLQPIGDSWFTASRWSAGVPDGGNAIFGGRAGANAFEVTGSTEVFVHSLTITNQSPTLRITAPVTTDLTIDGDLSIGGPDHPTCRLIQTQGRAYGVQTIGHVAGPGTLIVQLASTYSADGPLRVGSGGEGHLIVEEWGVLNVNHTQGILVGSGVGASGSLSVIGTVKLSTGVKSVFGHAGGNGELSVQPLSHVSAWGLPVRFGGDGISAPGNGTLTVDQGTINGSATLVVGSYGLGAAVVHGGLINVHMVVGSDGGSGSLDVSGVSGNKSCDVGASAGQGAAAVHGAGTVWSATNTRVGLGAGSMGTLVIHDGAAATMSSLNVGEKGEGEVRIDGGACTVTGQISIRPNSGATGGALIEVDGGQLNGGATVFGPGANATLRVSDGGFIGLGAVTVPAGPTPVIEALGGGVLEATSMTLGAATLRADSASSIECGPLQMNGGTIELTLSQGGPGAVPPIKVDAADVSADVVIHFADGHAPPAGSVTRLLTSTAPAIAVVNQTVPAPYGYPSVLFTDEDGLNLMVFDHVDAFELPDAVVFREPAIDIPATVTLDGASFDVSSIATWSVAPAGVVEHVGDGKFMVVAAGQAVITAQFGTVSDSVAVTIEGGLWQQFLLASGTATDGSGTFASDDCYDPAIFPIDLGVGPQTFTQSGLQAIFASLAPNLAADDTNGKEDLFLKDFATNAVTRLSKNGSTTSGQRGAITGDGRFVAFASTSNLAAGASGTNTKVFLLDRLTGVFEFVSVPSGGTATGASKLPRLSADGRFVAFESTSKLVLGDSNNARDVYVRDRQSATTMRASLDVSGSELSVASTLRSLAPLSNEVAFTRGTQGLWQLPYVFDCDTGAVTFEWPALDGSIPAVNVNEAHLSADGRYIACISAGFAAIHDGPLATTAQLYRRDRQLGTTEAVSVTQEGTWGAAPVEASALSASGRYAAFITKSTNLAPVSDEARSRLFRKDMLTGQLVLLSSWDGPSGSGEANADIMPLLAISDDGQRIAFVTTADNLLAGAPTGIHQVYVVDAQVPPLGDLDGDFAVGPSDLALLLGDWSGTRYDLDGDGTVGPADVAILLGAWQ